MQTLDSLPQQQQDWFLTTPDGSLAARIQDGLTIGEDDDGELEFNPTHALVQFERTEGSSLVLRVADDRLVFRTGTDQRSDTLTLTPWQSALLSLSSGALAIYPEIGEEQTRENKVVVALTKQATPAAVGHSAQVSAELTVTEAPHRAKPAKSALPSREHSVQIVASTAPEDLVSASLMRTGPGSDRDAPPDAGLASRLDNPTVPMSAIRVSEPVLTESSERPHRARSGHRLLVLNILALALVGWWFWPSLWQAASEADFESELGLVPSTPATPVTTPSVAGASQGPIDLVDSIAQLAETADPEDEATREFMVDTLETITIADPTDTEAANLLADLNARQELADDARIDQTSPIGSEPSSASTATVIQSDDKPVQVTPEIRQPSPVTKLPESTGSPSGGSPGASATVLDQELNRVTRLINQGSLVSPIGNNAVQSLRNLRYRYPDSAEVVALTDQCTEALLVAATNAYEDHRDFEARNILEEALSLSPTHPGANAKWRQWTRSRPRP